MDIETIDAEASAIQSYDGGLVLVSHDLRLIEQVAEEVWNVENGGVRIFRGDIRQYKEKLEKKCDLENTMDAERPSRKILLLTPRRSQWKSPSLPFRRHRRQAPLKLFLLCRLLRLLLEEVAGAICRDKTNQ